jgi:hypothetical protein
MKRLCVLILMVMLLVGCGGPRSITYRITGTTGNVDVTLTNASGGTEQRKIKPPYELAFDGVDGQALYISGQNKWDAGVVACDILVNGKVVQTATSSAAFGIATCSGKL